MLLKGTEPFSQCNQAFSEWNKFKDLAELRNGLSSEQYCAYDVRNNNACQSGSGDPLQYFPYKNSRLADVIGIDSFGQNCGNAFPRVYTRVASYLDWIESIVWPVGM